MQQDPDFIGDVPMSEINVKLNEIETLALECSKICACEWVCNAIHNRARIATDEIIANYVTQALKKGWDIPQNKLDIIKKAHSIMLLETENETQTMPNTKPMV
jgi:hypothetical protein